VKIQKHRRQGRNGKTKDAKGVTKNAAWQNSSDTTAWMGIFVPAGKPKDIVAGINKDFVWALTLPESKQRLSEQGAEAIAQGPAGLSAFLKKESAIFAKIIKSAGIPQE
jgi:tripartite-type tricarboxylate transporter receptor subunit TctC